MIIDFLFKIRAKLQENENAYKTLFCSAVTSLSKHAEFSCSAHICKAGQALEIHLNNPSFLLEN